MTSASGSGPPATPAPWQVPSSAQPEPEPGPAASPAADLDTARGLLQRGDLTQATALLERLCASRPGDSTALALLAVARRRAGRPAAARELLEQAVGIDAANPELWFNLGNVRRALEDDAGADVAFQRALDIDPDLVPALVNRGNLLRDAGQGDAAVAHYRRALTLQLGLVQGWLNLGRLLGRGGDLAGAADALRRAGALRPDDPAIDRELPRRARPQLAPAGGGRRLGA